MSLHCLQVLWINPNAIEKVPLCSHFHTGLEVSPWKELSSTSDRCKRKKIQPMNACHTTAHKATAFNGLGWGFFCCSFALLMRRTVRCFWTSYRHERFSKQVFFIPLLVRACSDRNLLPPEVETTVWSFSFPFFFLFSPRSISQHGGQRPSSN